MDAQEVKLRKRRVFRFVACGLLLIAGASWVWFKVVETTNWTRMERRLQEIDCEIVALNGPRPVLRGEPIPGDAWEDYSRAIERMWGFKDKSELWRYTGKQAEADPAAVQKILDQHADALDLVRRGTHRAGSRRTGLHSGEAQAMTLGDDPRLTGIHALSQLLVAQAMREADQGRPAMAAEVWLDLAQYANDLRREGASFAGYMGDEALVRVYGGLSELIRQADLSAEDLQRIGRELELLDASFAGAEVQYLGSVENFGQVIVQGRIFDYYSMVPKKLQEKGYGWLVPALSSRVALSSSFLQQDAWVSQFRPACRGLWSGEKVAWSALMEKSSVSWNLVNRAQPVFQGTWIPSRERQAMLRLLRIAAHYRATGEILDLDDPYGGKLLHREEGGLLKAWSVGHNGVDDGGSPDVQYPARGLDFVLEFQR